MMLADTLCIVGYRPEDDSWDEEGRQTYIHDDDATRAYLTTLTGILGRQGWERDKVHLRTWRHHGRSEIIEIEVGGSDTTGHYLHHMKQEVADGYC